MTMKIASQLDYKPSDYWLQVTCLLIIVYWLLPTSKQVLKFLQTWLNCNAVVVNLLLCLIIVFFCL